MAARTQGSTTAYIISLVLFVFLFVVSALLAIYFKTQIKGAQVQAQQALQAKAQLIKPHEESRAEIMELKGQRDSSGMSIVGQLLAQNERLKAFVNNSPKSSVEAIRQEKLAVGVDDGRTLIGEIRRLNAERAADADLIKKHEADALKYAQKLKAIEDQKMARSQEYEQTITGLQATLASLQGDSKIFRDQVDTQRQALAGQFETVRGETQTRINAMRSTIEQKDLQIDAQRRRLEELTRELGTTGKGGGQDLTRESDGTITSILTEERLVYIDRGRSDQILLGMTFEVFDKDGGVVVDEIGELRGKATIEVIRMSDRSSLCRIVRMLRGRTVNEADLIANIIYDPNISYRFFVFGDFDIDNTGQVTATDRRRVETMVTQWGGQLISRLSYNTDFLVLGKEPDQPQALSPSVVDPVEIERFAAQKRKYDQYQTLITEAKALSIPILNQNRFLALVGYYQR